ncbi:hypothetical protein KC343_g4663 [Hortaea werneckii]|nr:hypothetical protein KC352_g9844 [Hortaea werneckii]KAI7570520.1 hypothetical protein KC317_g2392 [Hortaea werneckii]KAI7621054.1 hypothetical protein KC346_g3835 [Hortaea werneckii]KAI7630380.1 hypothetical protein KC343_g4663 [Hortaea werneckii]KAI7677141.1 hypothetical protein KC319_g4061 [Hortaea werneckii]
MTTGTLLVAALAAAANAATLPQPKCCFAMTAYGGPGGTVGQLGDGQNRIGQNNLPVPQGTYCLNNGALTDSYGRGCIMTPPTGQFQCDVGAKPDKGFDIQCGNGNITFKGSDTFWSCPTGDHGGWNLYDRPVEGQKKCQPVWLVADSCYSECAPPPQTSSTKMTSSTKVSTTTKMSTSTKMSSTTKKTSSTTKMSTSSPMSSSTKKTSSSTKMSSSTKPTPSVSKSTSTTCTTWTPSMSKSTQSTPCPSSSTRATTSSKTSSSSSRCPTSSKSMTTSSKTSSSSSSCPTSSKPATTSMSYVCNPAHSYPNGATCISTMGSLTLYTPMPTTKKPASTSSMSMPTQQPPMSTKPANMPKGCPGKLSKDFEFPHQIIHINSAEPDKAYGNFFNGTMTSTISSMFNFDVPADAAGKTCSLEFMFPEQDQLETSAYTISGDGKANFYTLEKPAHKSNTFNTSPKPDKYLGEYTLTPGTSSKIHSMACPAGKTIGIWMFSATGSSLNYFQDFNPCPIGLFMNVA